MLQTVWLGPQDEGILPAAPGGRQQAVQPPHSCPSTASTGSKRDRQDHEMLDSGCSGSGGVEAGRRRRMLSAGHSCSELASQGGKPSNQSCRTSHTRPYQPRHASSGPLPPAELAAALAGIAAAANFAAATGLPLKKLQTQRSRDVGTDQAQPYPASVGRQSSSTPGHAQHRSSTAGGATQALHRLHIGSSSGAYPLSADGAFLKDAARQRSSEHGLHSCHSDHHQLQSTQSPTRSQTTDELVLNAAGSSSTNSSAEEHGHPCHPVEHPSRMAVEQPTPFASQHHNSMAAHASGAVHAALPHLTLHPPDSPAQLAFQDSQRHSTTGFTSPPQGHSVAAATPPVTSHQGTPNSHRLPPTGKHAAHHGSSFRSASPLPPYPQVAPGPCHADQGPHVHGDGQEQRHSAVCAWGVPANAAPASLPGAPHTQLPFPAQPGNNQQWQRSSVMDEVCPQQGPEGHMAFPHGPVPRRSHSWGCDLSSAGGQPMPGAAAGAGLAPATSLPHSASGAGGPLGQPCLSASFGAPPAPRQSITGQPSTSSVAPSPQPEVGESEPVAIHGGFVDVRPRSPTAAAASNHLLPPHPHISHAQHQHAPLLSHPPAPYQDHHHPSPFLHSGHVPTLNIPASHDSHMRAHSSTSGSGMTTNSTHPAEPACLPISSHRRDHALQQLQVQPLQRTAAPSAASSDSLEPQACRGESVSHTPELASSPAADRATLHVMTELGVRGGPAIMTAPGAGLPPLAHKRPAVSSAHVQQPSSTLEEPGSATTAAAAAAAAAAALAAYEQGDVASSTWHLQTLQQSQHLGYPVDPHAMAGMQLQPSQQWPVVASGNGPWLAASQVPIAPLVTGMQQPHTAVLPPAAPSQQPQGQHMLSSTGHDALKMTGAEAARAVAHLHAAPLTDLELLQASLIDMAGASGAAALLDSGGVAPMLLGDDEEDLLAGLFDEHDDFFTSMAAAAAGSAASA